MNKPIRTPAAPPPFSAYTQATEAPAGARWVHVSGQVGTTPDWVLPAPLIAERMARGDYGMKTGTGFYRWTRDTIRATRDRYEAALAGALGILGK